MTGPEAAEEWVWLARIRRPQGRKGEVLAELLTDFPEKFAERKQLWLLPSQEAKTASRGPRLLSGELAAGESDSAPAQTPAGAPREVELAAHWPHKGGVVLHFAGVDSISAAETLAGLIVAVPRAQRASLGEDEVYIGDLTGCTLFDVADATEAARPPAEVGVIEDVDRTAGPVALLVVRGASGEVLIPFAKSYLRKLDLEGKRIEMVLPEGLTGLNAPEKA